jgi:hypothetical protein
MSNLRGYDCIKREILVGDSVFDGPVHDDFIFRNPDADVKLYLVNSLGSRSPSIKSFNPEKVKIITK